MTSGLGTPGIGVDREEASRAGLQDRQCGHSWTVDRRDPEGGHLILST